MTACTVCATTLQAGACDWHQRCPACAYERGHLTPVINQQAVHDTVDEVERDQALRELRLSNAHALLSLLQRHLRPDQQRLLDVGCSHGWFLQTAARHFQALGIEPDHVVAASALAASLPVREGYFPDVLAADERFDVIVFNDVLEHIPDARAALQASHAHLDPGGVLLLNVPDRQGIYYRLACGLQRLGLRGPFRRMWQVGFPSPHVHYFQADNLTELLRQSGFELLQTTSIPAVSRTGLWQRIRYAQGSLAGAVVSYLLLSLALPVLARFQSDSLVCLFSPTRPIAQPGA